jgi:hypothetical protein
MPNADSHAQKALQAALEAVSATAGARPLPRREIRERARNRCRSKYDYQRQVAQAADQAKAHAVAVYLAAVKFDVPARALSRVAGISERQVRRTLRQIEDAREIPAVDRALDELEGRIAA